MTSANGDPTAHKLADGDVRLWHGDCVDVMANHMGDNTIDAVVCDPPYGIAFMGKAWDQPGKFGSRRASSGPNSLEAGKYDLSPTAMRNFQAWCETWAAEAYRVLKPGGHLLAFGGARTWHRLAAGVEDAGFEMRDSIAWLYGTGFPKSLDVSKAIDKAAGERGHDGHKFNTAGKSEGAPSNGGSPFRSDHPDYVRPEAITEAAREWQGWGTALKPAFEPIVVARKPFPGTVAANVQQHGTGAINVDACRVGDEVRINPPGSTNPRVAMKDNWRADAQPTIATGRWPTNVVLDEAAAAAIDEQSGERRGMARGELRRGATTGRSIGSPDTYNSASPHVAAAAGYGDTGGASRFFPTFRYSAKAPTSERPRDDDTTAHPTVKPLDLMRWLIRLVTPPHGVVLDPFGGSGTTGEAAIHEHMRAVLIEREAQYCDLIRARLGKPLAIGFDFDEVAQ